MVNQIGLLQQRDAEYLRTKCVCVGRDGNSMEKINLSIWRLDINKRIDILVSVTDGNYTHKREVEIYLLNRI